MLSSCEAKKTLGRPRDWAPLIEALAVFALIMLYIWWVRLRHPWLWMLILGFVLGTHFMHGESGRRIGFGWKSFREAFPAVGPWIAVIAGTAIATGFALGTVRRASLGQALLSAVAYVLWGLFQQYLLNGYFVNRLLEFEGESRGGAVAGLAAVLFSLVHLPNWFLMVVTLAGGYVCARLYLRYRSLYVLALAHGIVACALFFVVPDTISQHFLVGPRYIIQRYGTYPEFLL